MKEVKLETYNNRVNRKNKRFDKKINKSQKNKKKFIIWFSFGLFFIVGTLYFLYSSFLKEFLYGNECEGENCTGSSGFIASLVEEPELRKTGNLTNALIIGIDTREEQPGLLNTDTIMVLTYDHSSGNVFMTSLPRDLYVKIPAIYPYWSRINAVYSQGVNDVDHDTGVEYLTEVVEEITGLEIHYHAMINYEGFLQVIDAVDGIEVCVENEFYGQYPVGDDWEQVHFIEGCQNMDGETALRYARTRYSTNVTEASDFARAKRQQKVIISTKDKLLQLENLLNPVKLTEFIQIAGDNIKLSNYNQEDVRAGINILSEFDNSQIINLVLDPSIAGGNLIHVIPGDAYFLGSTSGSWTQIQDYVQTVIESPDLLQENAQIYVYNGGASVGSAGEMVEKINSNVLLNALVGGNTTVRDYIGIKIYDFSGGQMSETLSILEKMIEDSELITEIPESVDNWYGEDIVIIVGGEDVVSETVE